MTEGDTPQLLAIDRLEVDQRIVNFVLLGLVLSTAALAIATGIGSVYLFAVLLVTAAAALAGFVPLSGYDGPTPWFVGAYLLLVGLLIVA